MLRTVASASLLATVGIFSCSIASAVATCDGADCPQLDDGLTMVLFTAAPDASLKQASVQQSEVEELSLVQLRSQAILRQAPQAMEFRSVGTGPCRDANGKHTPWGWTGSKYGKGSSKALETLDATEAACLAQPSCIAINPRIQEGIGCQVLCTVQEGLCDKAGNGAIDITTTVPRDGDTFLCLLKQTITSAPTDSPTESPTADPTPDPTAPPTSSPTLSPTSAPTDSPTESPTADPTSDPTAAPTSSPTPSPTSAPTASPTESPTESPTADPTPVPTAAPTSSPTPSPTPAPTDSPTESPTESPTACVLTENAALSGHNIEHLTGQTQASCAAACRAADWGCKSFDWYKGSNECDLSDKCAIDVGGLKTDYSGNPYDHYACDCEEPCTDGTCTIADDPHINVFDGRQISLLQGQAHFDDKGTETMQTEMLQRFVADGEEADMWLVKSPTVSIQARYARDDTLAEENLFVKAIAVSGEFMKGNSEKGNRLIIGDLEMGVTFNGLPILVAEQSDFEHNGIIKAKRHLDSSLVQNPEMVNPGIDVELQEGVKLLINRQHHYINVELTMPHSKGGQDGLCGNFNGDGDDDSLELIEARNPRVASGESLF